MGKKKDEGAVDKSENEGERNEKNGVDNGVIGELEQFMDERIILNVGGIKYETYRSTLTAYPKTLLGTMFHPRNQAMLHPVNGNEYFIDRNGHAFYYIMEFYRTGSIVWRPSLELPFENPVPSPSSSTTTVSSTNSASNNTDYVPTGLNPQGVSTSNNNHVLHHRHQCPSHPTTPPIFPPYISLPELEQEFSYFAIPFTSPLPIAQKAGGALLDEFAYSIEDLLCTAVAKLLDRISITFFRDGSPMECILVQQSLCSNCSAGRCNNWNGSGAKLIEFSLNGYCIVNHFYEDIRKYLENVFPNMIFRLEFGNNYKSITMSMSSLFNRHSIQKYSKIGKLNNSLDNV